MEKPNGDVKEQILKAATRLFSDKGYEGAKMNEIAQSAGVNKALIYYYFPSKQSVLDCILDNFFDEIVDMGIGFIQKSITRLIEEGRLDILPDRMRFTTMDDLREFKKMLYEYYRDAMRHFLDRRGVLRIVLAEALRSGEQHDALFRFFTLSESNKKNPFYVAVYNADPDISYSKPAIFRKFFFSLLPMVNFAVFYDDYKAISGMNDEEMHKAYLNSLESLYAGNYVGQDIIIDVKGGADLATGTGGGGTTSNPSV
ncbi:MAG: TetR/AcrR family transcriptional regulator [Clostridiales bacterium]|jgi:AcrR family transcriptional regulator|nr:TetR/AcrR family transcriptional regulator [Clostridiales bacterium]